MLSISGDPKRRTFIDRYAEAAESLILEGVSWVTFTHLAIATYGSPISPDQKRTAQRVLPRVKERLERKGYTVDLVTKEFDPSRPLTDDEAYSVIPGGRGRKSFALYIPHPEPHTTGNGDAITTLFRSDPINKARSSRNLGAIVGKLNAEARRLEQAHKNMVITLEDGRRLIWKARKKIASSPDRRFLLIRPELEPPQDEE